MGDRECFLAIRGGEPQIVDRIVDAEARVEAAEIAKAVVSRLECGHGGLRGRPLRQPQDVGRIEPFIASRIAER